MVEGAGPVVLTITGAVTGGAASQEVRMTLTVAPGTAVAADYTATSATLTIAAGATTGTATLVLTPRLDTLAEGPETVVVRGTGAGVNVHSAEVTITDLPIIEVQLSVEPAVVAEDAGPTLLTVTGTLAAGATSREIGVSLTVVAGTAGAADYTATQATLTIAAGATTGVATVVLTPRLDTLEEGPETVVVQGTGIGLNVRSAQVTITDPPIAEVQLSVEPAVVTEGAGPTALTVTGTLVEGAASRHIQISVAVVAGTADPTDFSATGATFTIAAGHATGTATLVLTPHLDTLVEGPETVFVRGTSARINVRGAEVTINDPPIAEVHLSVEPAVLTEGAGPTSLTVTGTLAEGAISRDIRVALTVETGTASAADYVATQGTLTIAAGDATGTGTVILTPQPDTLLEGSETAVVQGTGFGVSVRGAGVTITDPPLRVSFAEREVAMQEGETHDLVIRYQIGRLARPLDLELSFLPDTASSNDFSAAQTSVRIPAGQVVEGEVTVALEAPRDRFVSEGDESLRVRLVPPTGAGVPRVDVGPDLLVRIAEAGAYACSGVLVRGDLRERRDSVAEATLFIDWENAAPDGSFDWESPYYDDEDNPEERSRVPVLEINLAEWLVETIEDASRHTLDIVWPRFLPAQLFFRSETGRCEMPRLTCSASACELSA